MNINVLQLIVMTCIHFSWYDIEVVKYQQ